MMILNCFIIEVFIKTKKTKFWNLAIPKMEILILENLFINFMVQFFIGFLLQVVIF